MSSVQVTRGPLTLPTYEPHPPDKNPMFLENRVYQGSSGRIYPLPFTDRVALERTHRAWDAVQLENEFLRVMILPEIGGRIHVGQDKTNGYDFFYRQPVIKPALVGLAGPWISGGVEFNWPQHHRPSTFMPADVHIEEHADGAKTVWLGEHDPLARMKGMHGVCLHPGRAYLEVKVRVYNRTPHVQTFLWWANVATRVHQLYQSFFPPDAHVVADHAKRAMSAYPLCMGNYYGVDYAGRARRGVPENEAPSQFAPLGNYAPNDLSWYANIPVPTSYMCLGTREDFFGGYDHGRAAGVVHIANRHIVPGKKQWTWGNHSFGYAWDRNLTDADERGEYGPYVELMAGAYTDNQPDFSFLMPGETKSWSQYWYPIQQIGPACHANLDAAVSLRVDHGTAHLGVSPSRPLPRSRIVLLHRDREIAGFTRDLAPGVPFVASVTLPRGAAETGLALRVAAPDGRTIVAYAARPKARPKVPPPAAEPALPAGLASNDELYLTGLHLEQYRHATRMPEAYWREALRRDPGDARCHHALGRWRLRRGEFSAARSHFNAAIRRLTARNPNPRDGEPHYSLGLALRHLGRPDEAYAAFYKATWNHAWQAAGYHALAEIDCTRHEWATALDHVDRALRVNADNLRARNLRALILRALGREAEARAALQATLALDPLDWWGRHLSGARLGCDNQVRLDLALDFARAGFFREALAVLHDARAEPHSGTAPLVSYYRAWLARQLGDGDAAARHLRAAASASPDYCFPARLEEIAILESALAAQPQDARAHACLGHLLYDRRRFGEAIRHWEKAAQLDDSLATVWRNLGIGYYNIRRQPRKARAAYERAFRADPADARVLFERDQLWKRLGEKPARRLRELELHPELVRARDDLSLELSALYNQTGQPARALGVLASRRFQPWEGGEGLVLGQHVRTHLALGRAALARGDASGAQHLLLQALDSPAHLGEARHLLASQGDVHFWLGEACAALGDATEARRRYLAAATSRGDFQEMSVRSFSELTYYSGLALRRLGKTAAAARLFRDLLAHARKLARTPAKIDYFATSLPTMLVFDDDLDARQHNTALLLEAQACLGLGKASRARQLLRTLLRRDPNHPLAADLLAAR